MVFHEKDDITSDLRASWNPFLSPTLVRTLLLIYNIEECETKYNRTFEGYWMRKHRSEKIETGGLFIRREYSSLSWLPLTTWFRSDCMKLNMPFNETKTIVPKSLAPKVHSASHVWRGVKMASWIPPKIFPVAQNSYSYPFLSSPYDPISTLLPVKVAHHPLSSVFWSSGTGQTPAPVIRQMWSLGVIQKPR